MQASLTNISLQLLPQSTMLRDHLAMIAAPMVNQSDLPFRILVRRHGSTLAYTQMLMPERVLNDQEYYEHHLRDLTADSQLGHPVVVQLCDNDVDTIVQAGRKFQAFCNGIDLNLGCPQEAAREGHYGAYLLSQKDWPHVQNIEPVYGMSHSLTVPTSVKLRLCQPAEKTLDFAQRLESCGASWVTLHARTVSARRRRQGSADLHEVKRLKEGLQVPVISNGNVRVWKDIIENLEHTAADGVMVGETLLGNPYLFINQLPDPVDVSLEYLDICNQFPDIAPISIMQTHVRHFIDFQCGRRPWFQNFRTALSATKSSEGIETLLRTRVERWRGRPVREKDNDSPDEDAGLNSNTSDDNAVDLATLLG